MNTMIIKMPRHKLSEMSAHIEDGLRSLGKAMQCVDTLMEDYPGDDKSDRMGYRNSSSDWRYPDMAERDYRHMGMRDDDMYDRMGERRMRDSRGRFM